MYPIINDFIKLGNARSGKRLTTTIPTFGVAHDTGNSGSTARNNRNYFNNHQPSASAHVFIDDKEILVIVPLSEKAWHVQYQKPMDNILFGEDANDAAIGVELCWGGKIDFQEAYRRYVWFWAWLCKEYNWNPSERIVSHKKLDPGRKTDPDNALNRYGITFEQFIQDVKRELKPETVVKGAVKVDNNKPSQWAEKDWNKAKELGLLDGTRPHDPVTRQELAAVLVRINEKGTK